MSDYHLEAQMKQYKQILENLSGSHNKQETTNGLNYHSPGLLHLCMYAEGSMFGDNDIFAVHSGYISHIDSRQMSAVSMTESSLFTMHPKEVYLI